MRSRYSNMRFFKKQGPRTSILLPNGDKITFDTVDGITGFYKTDDAGQIATFEKCIKEHRGGLEETDEATFNEFVKKKENSKPYAPSFEREAISAGTMSDTAPRTVRAAAVNPGLVG